MRRDFSYTEEQVRVRSIDESSRLKGKIYRINKGYTSGVIYRPYKGSKKEIFFESKDFVSRTNFEKARVGSRVSFRLETRDDKTYAVDVRVEGHIHDGDNMKFELPSGQTINCKSVKRYGILDNSHEIMRELGISYRGLKELGYSNKDFYCVYIKTVNHFYVIYKNSVPLIKPENMVESLDDYLKYLDNKIIGIPLNFLEREPNRFKAKKIDGTWRVVMNDTTYYKLGESMPVFWDSNSSEEVENSVIICIESGKVRVREESGRIRELSYKYMK